MKVFWSFSAEQDRDRIINYIAKDNVDAAVLLDIKINDDVDLLSKFPYSGRIGRIKNSRELVVHENYILVYSINNNIILINALLHSAQQYPHL